MHDYLDGNWPISCDWPCHIARGSAGGTDYAMPVGTPIQASFGGVLSNRPPGLYPASGNVAILTRADGIAFYHLHLSQFVAPGTVNEGDIIGYSGGAVGAPGSGSSTGPHLHVNAYDGNQIHDIHDYFTATASTILTPLPTTPPKRKKTLMGAFYRISSGQGTGTIFWQPSPGAKLVTLDLTTWTAYSVQGNAYAEFDAVTIQQLMRDTGTVA